MQLCESVALRWTWIEMPEAMMIRREFTVLDNDILQLTHSTQKPEAITPQGQGETMNGFKWMTEHSSGNDKENLPPFTFPPSHSSLLSWISILFPLDLIHPMVRERFLKSPLPCLSLSNVVYEQTNVISSRTSSPYARFWTRPFCTSRSKAITRPYDGSTDIKTQRRQDQQSIFKR